MAEVRTPELIALIEAALGRHRHPPALPAHACAAVDVELAAFWLLQAELLRLPAFGIQMLLRDLDRLDATAAPAAGPPVRAAALAIDASRLPGHLALALAVRLAAQAVREQGTAIVGIRHVGALGVLGCAVRSLASQGAVALVSAHSAAIVAPWGGTAAAIGTNPLAVAAPRADAAPLVIDYATSPMTVAALRQAGAAGSALPAAAAVDRQGRPTTDPAQAAALLPQGRIASLTGLALELLTGVGVGGRRPAGDAAPERTALLVAYAPEAMGQDAAAEQCAQLARDWHAAGGHVPGRFDTLPLRREQLPAAIAVDDAALAALRGRC